MDVATISDVGNAGPGARQIGTTFGAEVRGMPIHGNVSPEALTQFVSYLHRYRVLVVPKAHVTPADLVAFSRRFGPLEIHSRFDNTLPAHREVFCVGNVERDGMTASFSRGVEQWHADSSYREVPSDASLFYGEIVPPEGGETLFADVTAAWRSLDPALRQKVEGLRAVHSLETLRQWGQQQNPDRAPDTSDQVAKFPPVAQPLVRIHPATGAKSLYLCPAVISHIEGMDAAEGTALIEQLIRHATQPRFVYTHRWQQGDLVMWDNRAVLHTASLFDHMKYQRLMYRTTVAGGAPRLAA
ncbi:TauD/TfdA dioxygenase family protein [Rhodopila sp.]|uniref:TauD/TfdA dioxygenase family protein n=1 Tax=Rhodopila sp. TaxID=2480087 RepID=UPI003D13A4A0